MKLEAGILAAWLAGLVRCLNSGGEAKPATPQVVACYFHGTVRCASCLAIETRAGEVITNRFRAEMALGRLVFKSLNYDKPENGR